MKKIIYIFWYFAIAFGAFAAINAFQRNDTYWMLANLILIFINLYYLTKTQNEHNQGISRGGDSRSSS